MCSEATMMKSEQTLPFHTDTLPKFVLQKCEEELNETPDRKTKALKELRTLLQRNPQTSGLNIHDDLLVQFLRRNKYRMRDAHKNVENFVHFNKNESFLFKSVPDSYFDLPSTKALTLLPKRCPDGCPIVQYRYGLWNPNEIAFQNLQTLFTICFLQLLRDPMTQINGFKTIIDFEGTSLQHIKVWTPRNVHIMYHGALNCVPGRYKEIHLVNESFVMKAAWTFTKPFLSEKLRSRIIFHSSPEGLLDYFPRSVLPAKYGGTLLDSDMKDWLKTANNYQKDYTVEGQPNF